MRLPSLDDLTERQVSLAVVLLGLLLYLPLAGAYGLYDPWETHYSEVARQMMERGDYISLWWPGAPIDADHFWSKPVLSFWIMSLSMRLFGLAHAAPGTMALSHRPEWAVRLPFCLLGVLGIYGVYLCVSRFVSRRAGLLAALVIATAPLYSLVARQAMTDMAFVGPMTMALALGALALFDDRDQTLPRRQLRLGPLTLGWAHHPLLYLAVALFTLVSLPQLIVNAVQLRWTFNLGGHAMSLPGVVVMLPYIVGFLAFFTLIGRLAHKAPLYLNIAATLCGLATLAKGIAGLGLPVIVFVAYLGFTWNWRRLRRAQIGFGILLALLTSAVVAVPWHHAMLVRHGKPFWDELYGDNHWRRLVVGRHGDRGTFEYFLRELGYAVLPWIAIAPAALAASVMRRSEDPRRQGILWFGAIWFVAAYALVSLVGDQVPPLHLARAAGAGDRDRLLPRRSARPPPRPRRRGHGRARHSAPRLRDGGPLRGAQGRAAVHLALLLRLHQHAAGTALAAGARFSAPADRLRGGHRDRDPGARLAAPAAGGADRALRAGPRVHRFPPRRLPHAGDALLDPEGPRRQLLPNAPALPTSTCWCGRCTGAARTSTRRTRVFEGPVDERTVFLGDRNVENLKAWMDRHRGTAGFFLIERSRMSQLEGMVPPGRAKPASRSSMRAT